MWYLFGVVSSTDINNLIASMETDENIPFPLRSVRFNDIAIVAKEVVEWKVDASDKIGLLKRLVIYQKVLEEIMQRQLIIPMKFGTVVDSEDDIQVILEKNYELFRQALHGMEDKVEITLVISWKLQEQLKKIAEKSAVIQKMQKEAKISGDGNLLIVIGKNLDNELNELRCHIASEIITILAMVKNVRVNHEKLEDNIVLNASFLIARSDLDIFMKHIYQLDERFDKELNFKCLYPLPPYSFQTILVKKIASDQLKYAITLFEIKTDTTFDEIKKKKRELIQQYHPDVDRTYQHEVKNDFCKIQQAFEMLETLYISEEKPFMNINLEHCFLVRFIGEGHYEN